MEQELMSSVRYLGALPMVFLAIVLAVKNRGKVQSAVYNHSRYLLIAATLLLGIHFIIQYFGHFREQSFTLCWTINMIFFVAISPLYNMAELNLLRAGHNMRQRYLQNGLFIAVCYAIIAIGYFTDTLVNDAQPYLTATFVVAFLYFIKLFELSWVLGRDLKDNVERLTDEELTERHNALHYTAKVMKWIIFFSFATPWVGMSPSLLLNSIFGMVIFALIIWFLVKFLHYGENMAEFIEVNDEIIESVMIETENEAKQQPDCRDDEADKVSHLIEKWVAERRFTDPNITIAEALKEMSVSASALNFYLENHTPVEGYRRWLPYLRIEEAKRIILAHPEYSLDAVADACGYSDRSTLSRAFKAHEGVSPKEWAKNIEND